MLSSNKKSVHLSNSPFALVEFQNFSHKQCALVEFFPPPEYMGDSVGYTGDPHPEKVNVRFYWNIALDVSKRVLAVS